MATAVDFKALLLEERRKARAGLASKAAPAAPGSTAAPMLPSPPPPPPPPSQPSSSSSFCLSGRESRPRFDAAAHRIDMDGIGDVWHVTDFLSTDEELGLMRNIDALPPSEWVVLRGRRLVPLGGHPRPPPELMSRETLPPWAQAVCDALVLSGVFPADAPPNHILLNEYQPGEGIDAHKDGPLYAPLVAIVSLGSQCGFEFSEDTPERPSLASLLLPPRGLLVFAGDAYERHLHSVPARRADEITPRQGFVDLCGEGEEGARPSRLPRRRRLSLTVRRVVLPPEADARRETCEGA